MPKLLSNEDKLLIKKRLAQLDLQISIQAKKLSELRQERTKLKQRVNWYRHYVPRQRSKHYNKRSKDERSSNV